MAYLKGGTVVDGNLYVEGALHVKGKDNGTNTVQYTFIKNTTNNKVVEDQFMVYNSIEGQLRGSVIKELNNTDGSVVLEFGVNNNKAFSLKDLLLKNLVFTDEISKFEAKDNNDATLAESNYLPSGRVEYWAYA